jgi:hypothetical protein
VRCSCRLTCAAEDGCTTAVDFRRPVTGVCVAVERLWEAFHNRSTATQTPYASAGRFFSCFHIPQNSTYGDTRETPLHDGLCPSEWLLPL